MFTDRFLKLPVIISEEDGDGVVVDMRVNPFIIETYCADKIEYDGEDGTKVTSDAVRVYCRNDELIVALNIHDFEVILNK
jgi:hypothetical protein